MKQLKELFDANHLWISLSSVTLIGDWSTLDNTMAIDHRMYDMFGDKVIDRSFSQLTNEQITSAVADFINSHVYELDKLYATTEAEYDPIQNYSMTESGTDVTTASSEGDTTDYATSYNSGIAKVEIVKVGEIVEAMSDEEFVAFRGLEDDWYEGRIDEDELATMASALLAIK